MGTRVMAPARRATKDDLKRWQREELLAESEPKPKTKSKSKSIPTPAPTPKQRIRASANSSSVRKNLSAIRKPSGYPEEPLPSLNDIPEIDLDGQSGSSTSPSLAGTRSKRSLKVPARFSDPEFAFRDAVEPIRVNASREAKEHAGKAGAVETDDDESRSSQYTILSTPASTPLPSTPSKSEHESPASQKSKTASPSPKRHNRDEKRENEDAIGDKPIKILKLASSRPSVTLKKQSVSLSSETPSGPASASPTRPPLEQVPVSVQASEPSVKSEPASAESQNIRQASPSKKKKKKSSSKPRSRSPGKVYKTNSPDNIGGGPSGDIVGASVSNPLINMTIQPAQQSHKPQLQQLLQQPLPQIQQIHQLPHPPPKQIHIPPYGSRLLPMDQPILLPMSIAPIAPITTNLAAINGALRKPPFISPMLEMSLKHDKTVKQRLALENLPSMIRIASHMGIRDRMNLRQVSRGWKAIIDSETICSEALVTSDDLHLDSKLICHHLNRSRATDLRFKVDPSEIPEDLIKALVTQPTTIRRVFFGSKDRFQNTAVYNILKVIDQHLKDNHVKALPFKLDCQNIFIKQGEIHWKPRVTVDPLGYLRAEILLPCDDGSEVKPQEYDFIEEELDQLKAHFDWKSIYDCEQLVSLTIDCVRLS